MAGAIFLVVLVAVALGGWALIGSRSPASTTASGPPAPAPPTDTAGPPTAATPAPTGGMVNPTPPAGSRQSAVPSASIVPGPSPSPGESPVAADARAARAEVRRYELALVAGRYRQAWVMLAPRSRASWGSLHAYASERGVFFQSARSRFRVGAAAHDAATLARWMPRDFSGDAARAFVVRVDYPALAGNNAGWEIDVVAPDASGRWLIWIAR